MSGAVEKFGHKHFGGKGFNVSIGKGLSGFSFIFSLDFYKTFERVIFLKKIHFFNWINLKFLLGFLLI